MLKRTSTQKIILAVGLTTAAIFAACGKPNTGSSGGGSTNPSPTPGGSSNNVAFEVQITSQYEVAGKGAGATTMEADCIIPAGTAAYSAGALNQPCTNSLGTVNSTVAIPEGRLYYSALTFYLNVGTNPGNCQIMFFDPYYYQGSSGAAYTPPWADGNPITCNTTVLAAGCFGGIAQDVVPGFPQNGGVFWATSSVSSGSVTSHSANYHNYGSNRFAVNNPGTPAVAHTFKNGDAYLANSYQPYFFECADAEDDAMYSFTLTLTDDDVVGVYPNTALESDSGPPFPPGTNEFPDWVSTSWQY